MVRFYFRKMGVVCVIDGPAIAGCVGGAAIGTGGLKCRVCFRSGQFWIASSCLGLRSCVLIFKARATLLEVEMQDRPEDTKLMSSGYLRLRLIFLLAKSFLNRSF